MTGVNIMSVSRAVSALRKHGRILIAIDPDNRRRKILKLTAEGRRLYEIMRPQTDVVGEYLLSELRADEVVAEAVRVIGIVSEGRERLAFGIEAVEPAAHGAHPERPVVGREKGEDGAVGEAHRVVRVVAEVREAAAACFAVEPVEARPIATMTLEAQERHERIEKVSRDD